MSFVTQYQSQRGLSRFREPPLSLPWAPFTMLVPWTASRWLRAGAAGGFSDFRVGLLRAAMPHLGGWGQGTKRASAARAASLSPSRAPLTSRPSDSRDSGSDSIGTG